MVEVGTGGPKSRFIRTDWPNEEGLTAGTQTQEGNKITLEPEEETHVYNERGKGIR